MATDVETLVVRLEATQRKFEKQLAAANRSADKRARGIERRFMRMNKNLEGSFHRVGLRLAGMFAAVASVRGAQQLIDTSIKIQNALKVAGLAGDDLTKVYDRLFAAAQKNAAPLEALVELYSRVSLVSDDLGISQQQLIDFIDKVGTSMRVSGKSATEQAGAILQLTQALGNGTVQSEEYNSLLDGAQPLLQAVAAGLKEAGGRVSALTRLVKSGQVSSKAFFDAFEAGSYTLDQKVAGAELTVSQAFVRLQNVLVDTAGKFDDGTGASKALADALDDLGRYISDTNFDPMVKGIVAFAEQVGAAAKDTVRLVNAISDLGAALGAKTGLDQVGPWLKGLGKGDQELAEFWLNRNNQPPEREAGTGRVEGDATELPKLTTKPDPVTLADYPLTGGSGGGSGGSSGGGRSPADQFADEMKRFKQRTASITATTAALSRLNPLVDDYGYSIEKVHAQQELLNAAERAGVKITPEIEKKITDLANGYATASAEAEKLARAQDDARHRAQDFRDMGRDVMGGFIRDLRDGVDASEALSNALGKISDRLLDMALDSIFSSKGGGGGGFLSGLFGGGKGLFGGAIIPGILHDGGEAGKDGYGHGRAVPASVFSGARRYHRGSMGVGLRSDEVPAILQKGETVLPRNYGAGAAPGGGALDVRVISEVQNGNLVPVMTQVSGVVSGQQIRQANKTVPGRIVASQKRGV